VFTGVELADTITRTDTATLQGEGGIAIAKVRATGQYASSEGITGRFSADRPIASVVSQRLEESARPVVVDDFHFVERSVQREIVRALKPLVLAGIPIIFASVSHRVQDVVTAEPDMTGRVSSLTVAFWSEEELLVIARAGFEALKVLDQDEEIARKLAAESYGSPHLMQKFCREVCKADDVRQTLDELRQLNPPQNWDSFLAQQVDDASADWFQRLLRGPQERGSQRTQWPLLDGGSLDGYGLTLRAIASTGPRLSLSKDEIKAAVDSLVKGSGPAPHQTTRVLQHMTRIAAKRSSEGVPTEEELDQATQERQAVPDVQPVMEYIEEGPNSRLHIADPFFAFFLRWGSVPRLQQPPSADFG